MIICTIIIKYDPNLLDSVGLFHHVLVYMGNLNFDNGTISKIDDDVLLEHSELPYVLPFAVDLKSFLPVK